MHIVVARARMCLIALTLLSLAAGYGTSSALASAARAPTNAGKGPGGDIPDTATYLTYHAKGYSLKYVEGWSILLRPNSGVAISDKDSSETVEIGTGTANNPRFAASDLTHLSHTLPSFHLNFKRQIRLPAGVSIRAQYRTLSPRDPVTNKRVPVLVDRYYIAGTRRHAILTLATPVGVDNVDAFRLIAASFKWS